MYERHRVVCVTPAGRRRFLRLLAPQVLASPLVDRWDLWVNTSVPADLAFLRGLERLDSRVRLVPHPDGRAPCVEAIGAFSRLAIDPAEVYVRLDDDVVWMEPGFFESLLAFRLAHPEHFLVMPLVLNNALCTNVLQTFGKVHSSKFVTTTCLDKVAWRDGEFAVALHRLVLDLIRRGEVARLHCGPVPIALNRFSINCISWFGRDMALAGGVVGEDEEEELSAAMGVRLRRTSCFHTDTAVAHLSFYSQRDEVDSSDVLSQYEAILAATPALADALASTRALEAEANALDDGSTWSFPPPPRRRPFRRLRRWLRHRRRPPVVLRPGPGL
jgi:hypothetical protein